MPKTRASRTKQLIQIFPETPQINNVGQHFYGGVQGSYPQSHYSTIPGGHLQSTPAMQHSSHSPSPPNMIYHRDERSQRQQNKFSRKLEQKHKDMSKLTTLHSNLILGIIVYFLVYASDFSPVHPQLNISKRMVRNGVSSVGTSEDGEESSSIPDDDSASIVEELSKVNSPQVSEITSRGKNEKDFQRYESGN